MWALYCAVLSEGLMADVDERTKPIAQITAELQPAFRVVYVYPCGVFTTFRNNKYTLSSEI